MIDKIILASKSGVRKKILEDNKITCKVEPANIDEDSIKDGLLKEKASAEIISKNLAELKANKISQKRTGELVLGADSVIDLNGKIISKPVNRDGALKILHELNGQTHHLISSVCISHNGSMIWNYTDKASLTMKQMGEDELISYLAKISDEALYAYNVYQIEGEGRSLFSKIDGDEDTIMGLPVKKIKEYLNNYK
jgi:septum formation protein